MQLRFQYACLDEADWTTSAAAAGAAASEAARCSFTALPPPPAQLSITCSALEVPLECLGIPDYSVWARLQAELWVEV